MKKQKTTIWDRFDGYVIPEHLEGYELKSRAPKYQRTVRYWTVTITLTSGEVEEFYIKAKDQYEALEKANSLDYIAQLRLKGGWRLLP